MTVAPRTTSRLVGIGDVARAFLIFILFAAGAFGIFRGAWQQPASWAGGCCDPEQAMWFLRWTPYALRHGLNPFFTVHINYPDGVNLLWNTSMFLPGLLLTPVTMAFGPIVAYNVLLLLGVALSAWCACLAIRRYVRAWWGAVVGGAVYGFSPYVISQAVAHVNLAFVPIPPLLLLMLDEIVVRQRRSPARLGALLGVLAAAQFFITEEVLATAAIVAAILLLVLAVQAGRSAVRHIPFLIEAGGWTLSILVGLTLPALIEQFLGPQRLTGQINASDVFSTDLVNFVVPTEAQALAPDAALQLAQHFSGLQHEADAYIGFPLLVLLAFVCGRLWERPTVRVAATMALIIAVLSMGPRLDIGGRATALPLPWGLAARLPILEDVLTNRMTVFMYLAVGIVLAVFVDEFTAKGRLLMNSPALLATAVALVPLLPRLAFPTSSVEIPPIFQNWPLSGVTAGSVVLVAPRAEDGGGDNQMLWQAIAGDRFAMPDGYFLIPGPEGDILLNSRPATLFDEMDDIQQQGKYPTLDAATRRQLARDIQRRSIDAVVVGPMPHRDLMVRYFSDLLARAPKEVGGVELWRHVRQEGVKLEDSRSAARI